MGKSYGGGSLSRTREDALPANRGVGSTYVHRYRRSYGWRHAHRQLAFPGVRPQRTGGPWPDLPHLKHSFNDQIVWEWLVKSNPRGCTSGKPRGLGRCCPRGLLSCLVSPVPGGTDRSWGRCAPARRWRALPRHLKPLPCMRCRRRRRRWRRPSWRIPRTRPCPPLPSTP